MLFLYLGICSLSLKFNRRCGTSHVNRNCRRKDKERCRGEWGGLRGHRLVLDSLCLPSPGSISEAGALGVVPEGQVSPLFPFLQHQ